MSDLLEWLAKRHHDQWIQWTKYLAQNESLSETRLARWRKVQCPYDELSEADKELDRRWGREEIEIVITYLKEALK